MTLHVTLYAVVLGAASLLSAVVAVAAVRRRQVAGGTAFALMMLAVVFWTSASTLGCASFGLPAKILFTKLGYIGAQCVAPLFLVFALQYSGASEVRSPLIAALMWVIPAVSIVLALTNESHRLVWTSHALGVAAGGDIVNSAYGSWYWVSLAYLAALDLAAAVELIRLMFRAGRVYRTQTLVLLAALAAPWIGEAVSDVPSPPFPGLDTPAVGCAIAGVLIILGLLRYRLLDIVPVARRLLVERMTDGLLVLDGKDRIVDANPEARSILGFGPGALGLPVERVSEILSRVLHQAAGREVFQAESSVLAAGGRQFDLHVSAITSRDNRPAGRMIVMRDVTSRRQTEAERERLIGELRAALADIKTLRGLLPICMSCRKIRDDRGYWKNLEQYVQEHTEAQFSHGLCDDCMRRLYPEYLPPGEGA
jgi:PAS domain S-box-containing protein